jgi:phosphoglycerate dehydrogenase-like enzyme
MKIVSSILLKEHLKNELMEGFPEIDFYWYDGISEAEASFFDAEVLITYGKDLTHEFIDKTTKLKWIMVLSAGLEEMPLSACKKKGILVTNVRGIHKIPMAEFTLGLMLQHVKQTKTLWKNQQKQEWKRKLPMGELYGKSILILGVGAIGGEIARLASAFQMKTIGINSSGKAVEHVDEVYNLQQMEVVLPRADFVVAVLPSTVQTRYLLKEKHFELMKDSAVFINIGRGDLIDEKVLLSAMETRQIDHFYLDVLEHEPLPKHHPFWEMDNVTVTPHMSSLTKNYLPRSIKILTENLRKYLNKSGDYINVIDLERGY